MNSSLIITEDKVKRRLQQSILRKRKTLEMWMEKVEVLKMELDLIKYEYTVRIGYLLLKDNQLDLEIIQYKNLKRLMDEGMTYEEAVKAEEDKFYNEILQIQKEQERLAEEKSFFERRQEISEEVKEDTKALWKKLIRKFHPDLVMGLEEKKKMEHFMKQINKAYTEGDYATLLELENTANISDTQNKTAERLEEVLVQTENLIQKTKATFVELRESEWYMWKKKIDTAKKEKGDVFAELEKRFLDDVVKKITILRDLRTIVHPEKTTQ